MKLPGVCRISQPSGISYAIPSRFLIELLAQSRLGMKDDRLILSAAEGWSDMLLGEQTARRAAQLAGLLGVKLDVRRR